MSNTIDGVELSALTSQEAATAGFSRAFRGYSRKEVDQVVRRISYEIRNQESGSDSSKTALDVDEATFRLELGGYDEEQVDSFLDRATQTFRSAPPTTAVARPSRAIPQSEPQQRQPIRGPSFQIVDMGYNRSEVDRTILAIAKTMAHWARSPNGALVHSPESLRRMKFAPEKPGYSPAEVNAFLHRSVAVLQTHTERDKSI